MSAAILVYPAFPPQSIGAGPLGLTLEIRGRDTICFRRELENKVCASIRDSRICDRTRALRLYFLY